MDSKTFRDKVYACWMGKNIGGTLGGPLEGRMELMDIKGYTQSFVESVENDDLDLQLVNLHCVEQYGGRADMALLSREWLEHVHFEYDEYGHSLTNMRRGISSPLSGCFNNFFTDCMGSPIRSEIWAVICAGMPDLAAYYAYHDASVDHAGGEGVYGEIFFAVLEAMAFECTDKFQLIDKALGYLPESCAVRRAVQCLLESYHAGKTWVEARQIIIDRFAGDNFTYAPVNIAFTLVGWLYEEGFTQQMLTTIDCGYDTDCTVATLGSLLGILYGTEYIDPYWTKPLGEKIITSKPITGFAAPKTISELTERSISARELVQSHYERQQDKSAFVIPYLSDCEYFALPLAAFKEQDLLVTVKRCPSYAPKESVEVLVTVKNPKEIAQCVSVSAQAQGFSGDEGEVTLSPMEEKTISLHMTAPEEKAYLAQGTLLLHYGINKVLWRSETLPLNFFPTMDWKVTVNGETRDLYCRTNRIGREQLGDCKGTIILETKLSLAMDGGAVLKIACANPIKACCDGECVIDCGEKTIVIPAYHRADPKKCAKLPETAGMRHIRIEVGDAEHFTELYCMVVSPDLYWAYRIDSVFSID